jgi:serine/threonine protein kinase
MVDFGTSKVFEDEDDILAGKDFRAGTEEFRAPERCERLSADRVINGRKTDIWAAGLTLYSIAT